MAFTRSLHVKELRTNLEEKLKGDGLSSVSAKKAAHLMSPGNAEQVQKDAQRHPKIIVVDEKTGKTTQIPLSQFDTPYKTKGFLRKLARENEALYEYLQKYLHQGGFLHLTELLLTYYYTPDVRFSTDNRVATFTIHKDGSIGYEEKFDITAIKTDDVEIKHDKEKPLASFSLKSTLKMKGNIIEHTYEDVKVKAHDNVTKKFIADPRNKFSQFLSWMGDLLHSVFSKVAYQELQQKEALTIARKKL